MQMHSMLYSRCGFVGFDQKMISRWGIDQTEVNLPLGLRRCNCWKHLATTPLQALPLILRCRGIPCIASCGHSYQGSNWGHGFAGWNHIEKQIQHSPPHVQVRNSSRSLCNYAGKAHCSGERRVVIQSSMAMIWHGVTKHSPSNDTNADLRFLSLTWFSHWQHIHPVAEGTLLPPLFFSLAPVTASALFPPLLLTWFSSWQHQ